MSASKKILVAVVAGIFWVVQLVYGAVVRFLYIGAPKRLPPATNPILTESASSLARRIRKQEVQSRDVVQAFVDRVKEINEILNCVVDERFEEALKDAKKIDEFIASGRKSERVLEFEYPLLGVPFTTKNSISVKGLDNSAGVWARKNVVAEEDAEVTALMRSAGAIPLACTNVAELSFTWETSNPVFGRTCNPYDTRRSVAGSSGGEGAVIASCGSPLGVGSDFGGSIRLPAAFSGIFGHKPSANVSPLAGLFPDLRPPQNACLTVGPMAKYSEDLLLTLKIITKNSKVDLKLDEAVNVKKLKYYYMEDDGGNLFTSSVDKEIKKAMQMATNHFKEALEARVERVHLERMKKAMEFFLAKANTDSGPHLGKALMNYKGKINVTRELVKSLFGLSRHSLILLLTIFMEERVEPYDGPNMKQLRQECSLFSQEFQELLGEDGVFIYPTQPKAAFYHTEGITKAFNLGYTAIFNVLGFPATHCPLGQNSEGLPIGFQVVAGMNQDRLTIAVAREIDRTFGGWKPPPTQ